jgi:hypothetical protein
MPNTISRGNRNINAIEPGKIARITSDAYGAGTIRYGNSADGPRGPVIGANADMLFGPFAGTAVLMVNCTAGTITIDTNYRPEASGNGLPITLAEANGTAALINSRMTEAQRTAINALDPATATVETIVQALQA